MKFLICILFLVSLFHHGFCGVASGFFSDPGHPGKCVYKGLILSPGEEGKPKGECLKFKCGGTNGYGTIYTCGSEAPMPNCKFGDFINVDAPYTDCCKRHQICDEDN
ncbi:uncharacterized protein LOC142219659 [Haematobia irritans]|uniref:uncharacterized protein LOC142219659 n=1 Tax=Haematobia irritans TaxID=7368 RepID=UPI003F5059DD